MSISPYAGCASSSRRQLFAVIATFCLLFQQSVLVVSAQISAKRSTAGQRGSVTPPPSPPPAPYFSNPTSTVFINEILYDITGTDAGEFVEVSAPAGTNMATYSIVLYNGANGAIYDTDALSGTTTDQQGGYGFVSVSYPSNGIQNGSPDGIALINTSTNSLVQFLCYEGTFAGVGGLANGVTCTDIGVSQTGTNVAGTSLQLQGTGTTYGNFTWNATSIAHTQNAVNTGQTFTGGGGDIAPTVADTTPDDNAGGVAQDSNIQIVFSEAVNVGATWFQIVCGTSGTRNVSDTVVTTADNITFTINPNTDFAVGELCTVTVAAAQVTDQDTNDPPDNMAADFVFDFTTGGGPPTPIHVIQGSGTASPFDGQVVTTTGIVTLLKTGTNNGGPASAFFLQAPDAQADADPNTSEGILVFTSSIPAVAVGDAVSVTGTVDEFFDMTEITAVTNVTVNSTGNPLPTAVTLTTTILDPAALPTQPQLEKFEGMRMTALSLVSVAPNDNFFDVETVLGGVVRPMREPGIEISQPVPPDPTSGVPDCCIPRWDENPERLSLDTNARAGAPLNPYTSNVTFSTVSGPLDFSFARYRLIPDASLVASPNMSAVPVPSPNANEFTVAGFNIENFNNNATQRQKAALAIRDVMQAPHIIGHAEIFELSGLQALAAEVNAISPGRSYVAHLVEADGSSGDADQDVAFLIDTSRVRINSITQIERAGCDGTPANCNTFTDPNTGLPALLNDRPPLVLDANIDPSGANLHVLVVVNHLRSFIDIELVTGEGPRVRAKRKAQAEFLADLLQDLQTDNPTTSVISVGDYNAYQFNDGYTDPIATIKGDPTADDQVVVDQSPDLVNPNLSNLIDQLLPGDQYSFIFEGTPQVLDHVIVNTVALARVTRTAIARNNADFPEAPAGAFASNEARPERCSDHDMPVAYFSLGEPQPAGTFIISEYRLRGSGAGGEFPTRGKKWDVRRERGIQGTSTFENDEFIEFYNNTDSAIRVQTVDGSAGWALVASDGITRFTIPNGTVIRARGHYLATNEIGYSLSNYPGGNDGTNETFSSGDILYDQDIPDGSGIALFNTSNPENFDEAHRLDAVGYSANPPLYREGSGFNSATPGPEIGGNFEYCFVRDLRSGTHKDTNDNAADFIGIDTRGIGTTNGTNLGAPGPENLFSPIRRLGMTVNFLDPSVAFDSAPNRVRDFKKVQNGEHGTISIRRTVTNNTGGPVTRLRFRIKEITTLTSPPVAGQADLRALSSEDIVVTVNDQDVPVQGTLVEGSPPFQPDGGGWNTSWSPTGTINLESPLPAGASFNVHFVVGVMARGSFRIFINLEALP